MTNWNEIISTNVEQFNVFYLLFDTFIILQIIIPSYNAAASRQTLMSRLLLLLFNNINLVSIYYYILYSTIWNIAYCDILY